MIGACGIIALDGRDEVPPELGKLESAVVGSIGKVGEVEGDGDAMTVGLVAMDGGGSGVKGGGKGHVSQDVDSEGGDDGAVPVRGSWVGQER